MKIQSLFLILVFSLGFLTACGQRGPLYHPEKPESIPTENTPKTKTKQ